MIKLNAGFSDYSADDLVHLGQKVAANLPGIAVLATLKPTPAQITTAVGKLTGAMAMVGSGRAQAVETAFDALAELLSQVATNAPQIAGVTDTNLAEIGLPVVKAPTRATMPPPAPQNLRLQHGQAPGEVVGKCQTLGEGIRTYEGQWALDPNAGPWSETVTFPNSRSFKFASLARGKDVWVRVRARNTVGAGPWSDPATIMVT